MAKPKRKRRKQNPEPITIALVAAVVGAAIWAASRLLRRPRGVAPGQIGPGNGPGQVGPGGGGTDPGGGGAPSGGVPANVVGTGWKGWPAEHKDLFPDEFAFMAKLSALTYPIALQKPSDFLNAANRQQVRRFQQDYNAVSAYLRELGLNTPINRLDVDGYIGKNTTNALAFAWGYQEVNEPWPVIVAEAKANAGIA